MRKIKNILILAGGDSTRFWPLTNKSFISFLEKPLINHLINSLQNYAEKIYIVGNEGNKDLFDKLIGDKAQLIIQDQLKSGMAGAVSACKEKIRGETLIINSNDLINFKILEGFFDYLDNKKARIGLLAKKIDYYFQGGYFQLKNKKIIGIVEKPIPNKAPSDLINLVFHYFKDFQEFTNIIEQTKTASDDDYEKALTKFISIAHGADYIVYKDYWYTLKYPWHILQMMTFFLSTIIESKIDRSVKISAKAKIVGHVYFGKNVKVGDFSKIVGPCYIGNDTVVADYCLIRESHIGKGCLIGSYTEVARSYISDNVMLHRNYIGDSILDNGVEMGAQTITANIRFDKKTVTSIVNNHKIDSNMVKLGAIIGQGSKIGVNSSILPGIKIGRNSFIGPKEVVTGDIAENMFVFQGKAMRNKVYK